MPFSPEAQELLALNRFLDIKDPQLAFGVRQRTPANLDQAVGSLRPSFSR